MSFRTVVMALGLLGVCGASYAADKPAKVEKKCDAAGKECKSGKDCKPENCKADAPN